LNLLARVSYKYEHAVYFSSVVKARSREGDKNPTDTRFRIALRHGGAGTITKFDADGVEHWVYDGRKILATASRRPQNYIALSYADPPLGYGARDDFFARAGFGGTLSEMLTSDVGRWLLHPYLSSLTLQPTTENGAAHKIVVAIGSGMESSDGGSTMTLFVARDLTLQRSIIREGSKGEPPYIWDEIYSEITIKDRWPYDFINKNLAAPPKNFKRVDSFDKPMQATPPVNNDMPKKARESVRTTKLKSQK
jgi:hypothetical protein